MGNTVVWTPAPTAAFTAATLMGCLAEAGLPPGVVNLVTGMGADVGDELVVNPGTHAVAMTGSSATGEIISRRAGLKPRLLELGGNEPLLRGRAHPGRGRTQGGLRGRHGRGDPNLGPGGRVGRDGEPRSPEQPRGAWKWAERLRTGVAVINDQSNYWEPHVPFGGMSGTRSGVGRLGGKQILEFMSDLQTIAFHVE
jgi:acyl-CoA reductase-like NAD-dependent aldehyde dehydrogenase